MGTWLGDVVASIKPGSFDSDAFYEVGRALQLVRLERHGYVTQFHVDIVRLVADKRDEAGQRLVQLTPLQLQCQIRWTNLFQ